MQLILRIQTRMERSVALRSDKGSKRLVRFGKGDEKSCVHLCVLRRQRGREVISSPDMISEPVLPVFKQSHRPAGFFGSRLIVAGILKE